MQFEDALKAIKDGKRVTNLNWNEKSMYLIMSYLWKHETENIKTPFIKMELPDGSIFPWNPSQLDLSSDKWEVLEG